MAELIRLRDLPGVSEIEAALHVPGRHLLKEYDDLDERIITLSRRLFGLANEDTYFVPGSAEGEVVRSGIGRDALEYWVDNEAGQQRRFEWDMQFEFLEYEYDDEAAQFWTVMGWEVTDGAGEKMLCMEYLARPLVCLVKRLDPRARLSLEGSAPGASQSAEEWGARLAEQARCFKPRR